MKCCCNVCSNVSIQQRNARHLVGHDDDVNCLSTNACDNAMAATAKRKTFDEELVSKTVLLIVVLFLVTLAPYIVLNTPVNAVKGSFKVIHRKISELAVPATNVSSYETAQPQVQLFVGVVSASSNRAKRDAVRSTWGAHPELVRVVFVISKPESKEALELLSQEAMDQKDIIMLNDVIEHYDNLAYQTLEIFRTAYAFQGPITHVMKCDDDSYIHVNRLLPFLAANTSEPYSWAGHFAYSYQPDRGTGGKWYVSKEEWPEDHSKLKWTNGPGYVLTKDLADLLVNGGVARCAPGRLFKLEDIAMGSWLDCLEREQGIQINAATSNSFNEGNCKEGDMVSHYMKPSQMVCMHAQEGRCCKG